MQMDPRLLAQAIIGAAPSVTATIMESSLALALSRGEGVAKNKYRVCVVLRNPWKADRPGSLEFLPTILAGNLPGNKKNRAFRSTSQVAGALATEGSCGKRPGAPTFAPAVTAGARLPLAGKGLVNAKKATGHMGYTPVTWYDLNDAPVGSFVYRVRDDGSVILYQRVGPDHWISLQLDGSQDIVNVPVVIRELCTAHQRQFTGLQSLQGKPVLLREPK